MNKFVEESELGRKFDERTRTVDFPLFAEQSNERFDANNLFRGHIDLWLECATEFDDPG